VDIGELLLEAFEAAGADDGLVYVSVPITSGPRELRLMAELRCTREELRSTHKDKWLSQVVGPNEGEAVSYAARIRALFPQQVVVEPARLHVSGWSQMDYGGFWEALIRKYALRLVATPHWAYSSGCRQEIEAALQIGLPILDVRGEVLTPEALAGADLEARRSAIELGFSAEEVDRYLPPISIGEVSGLNHEQAERERREAIVNRASSEAFMWLRGERALQLNEFGPDRDDAHTLEGLGPDGWWARQLTKYMERARELGLETEPGRQALAKFVATAIALLESSVRLYGWLPAPGIPIRTGDHTEE
jgi:hypothetical protein